MSTSPTTITTYFSHGLRLNMSGLLRLLRRALHIALLDAILMIVLLCRSAGVMFALLWLGFLNSGVAIVLCHLPAS